MARDIIVVKAARDPDAGVWFVESSDVPGLNLEAETLEELVDKLPGAVADLLEIGGFEGGRSEIPIELPIELIAHASTRVRLSVAA
ncbi:DUF1902 domain-containing protein [Microbaculum sp. FT89]|uniref:DUF1902 domain-containing protein n=1 Tax=Microbaculum sp. FT89 TaxID=3447298 RepID=UPI003F52EFEB